MRNTIILVITFTMLNIAIHYLVVNGMNSRLAESAQKQKIRDEQMISRVNSLHEKADFNTRKVYDFERVLNKTWESAVNCFK